MTRPKLQILKKPVDRFLESVALFGLFFLIIYPITQYSNLPDKIPSHFNSWGTPDAFRNKNFIWFLPVIGILLFLSLNMIKNIPHKFNYLVKITEENAEEQYRIAVRLIRILNTVLMLTFAYINWTTVQVALKKADGLWNGFPLIFLIIILVIVFSSVFFSLVKK